MSLQATVLLDTGNVSQTLTYSLSGTQIDQIVYNNGVILGSTAGFNLSKSDYLIYVSSLNAFVNDLILNIPGIQGARSITLPPSTFEFNLYNLGVTHIYYTQTSNGNSVYNTNYVPVAQSASIAARSQITISVQEFLFAAQMMNFHATQVTIN